MRFHIGPWLSRMLAQRAIALAPREQRESLWLVDLSCEGEATETLIRLRQAIELVRSLGPRQYRRLLRDCRYVAVLPPGGALGAYWHGLRLCGVASDHLMAATPTSVAMTLVHEAMHARIAGLGIPYDEARRGRIEQLCVAAEVDLVRQLPDGEAYAAAARAALDRPWWREADGRSRRHEQLGHLGLPEWGVRWLRRTMW